MDDHIRASEFSSIVGSLIAHEPIRWRCHTRLEKYDAGIEDVRSGTVEPTEVTELEGNTLLIGGADVVWLGIKNGLTATTGQGNTFFDNANAGIRVGNSTTAATSTQTNLQGSTNYTKGMDATFPTHTTGTGTSTSQKILYKATFSTAEANFTWNEWGVVNTTSTSGGRMLNRKVEGLGTKSTSATWAFTVTLSLA